MPDLAVYHGPVSPSVHARVDELLDHHHTRPALLAVLADGPLTAHEGALAVRWTSRNKTLADPDLMNQMLDRRDPEPSGLLVAQVWQR
jgi:hypothetical protein